MRCDGLERAPSEAYETYGKRGAERRPSPEGGLVDTLGSAHGLDQPTARAFLKFYALVREVGKRAVRFRHPLDIFTLLHGGAFFLGCR